VHRCDTAVLPDLVMSPHHALTQSKTTRNPPSSLISKTMLRVLNPEKSIEFYIKTLGFTLIDKTSFKDYKFDLYFLTTLPAGQPYTLTPETTEAHKFLWNYPGVVLELTHNYDTTEAYNPGNSLIEGNNDGFGHVAVNCIDVYASSEALEASGVPFKKRPDEGRMKGLAFVKDPDEYWVEVIKRGGDHKIENPYNFSQTMLRIKDPALSLPFYESLGMKVIDTRHFGPDKGAFSLYFLGTPAEGEVFLGDDVSEPQTPQPKPSPISKSSLPPLLLPIATLAGD
jgi:lactoylglutathione lyase